ncbi:MAG: hypothetical protein OEV28_00050 [Nitrospirota bacterium]|nr:hypothetical protein [Nitrospirota bacterium]
MTGIFSEKRQALETLLHEMENLKGAVCDGLFEDVDAITVRQAEIIEKVTALDRKHEKADGREKCSGELAEELKELLGRIAEINNGLIAELTKRSRDIQQELGGLHRGADAAAGYRKQAGAKI